MTNNDSIVRAICPPPVRSPMGVFSGRARMASRRLSRPVLDIDSCALLRHASEAEVSAIRSCAHVRDSDKQLGPLIAESFPFLS
jgi:hypothetical protein